MGEAQHIHEETCSHDGIDREVHYPMVAEHCRILVQAHEPAPAVVLCFLRRTRPSPSAPWSTERATRYEISPLQARHLAQLLALAAARAAAAGGPEPSEAFCG